MHQVDKQFIAKLGSVQLRGISYRNQAHVHLEIDSYRRHVKGKLLESDGGMEFCSPTYYRKTTGVPRYGLMAEAR